MTEKKRKKNVWRGFIVKYIISNLYFCVIDVMEIFLLIKTHIVKPCFKGIEPNVIHPETNVYKIWKMPVCPMEPLLEGKSEIGAHL